MEANLILITLASILGASGIALFFIGFLIVLLTALGNKHYIGSVLIFLFFPAAFVYGYLHRGTSAYANRLLYSGLVLFVFFLGLMWFELNRLGLDFVEIMTTTKPKH